jgi:hypothetical protein
MALHRCPGMDVRFWKPKDIFDLRCPHCGTTIEFWKDDPKRTCSGCGKVISNPHIDLGCAKWCQYAEECLGISPDASVVEAPIIERLSALLERELHDQPERLQRARSVCANAESLLNEGEHGDPRIIQVAALVLGSTLKNGQSTQPDFIHADIADDPQRLTSLLGEAGIISPVAKRVCELVEAVHSGCSQESQECTVIWKALRQEERSP